MRLHFFRFIVSDGFGCVDLIPRTNDEVWRIYGKSIHQHGPSYLYLSNQLVNHISIPKCKTKNWISKVNYESFKKTYSISITYLIYRFWISNNICLKFLSNFVQNFIHRTWNQGSKNSNINCMFDRMSRKSIQFSPCICTIRFIFLCWSDLNDDDNNFISSNCSFNSWLIDWSSDILYTKLFPQFHNHLYHMTTNQFQDYCENINNSMTCDHFEIPYDF